MVCGQNLFTLIALLLERHLELFQLGKRIVFDSGELREASTSLKWVLNSAWVRHNELKGMRLDPEISELSNV